MVQSFNVLGKLRAAEVTAPCPDRRSWGGRIVQRWLRWASTRLALALSARGSPGAQTDAALSMKKTAVAGMMRELRMSFSWTIVKIFLRGVPERSAQIIHGKRMCYVAVASMPDVMMVDRNVAACAPA
jgi:hypothetical protein